MDPFSLLPFHLSLTPLTLGCWAVAGLLGAAWGLHSGPGRIARVGLALFLLTGVGVVFTASAGLVGLSFWFALALSSVAAVFGFGLLCACVAFFGRRLLRGEKLLQRPEPRENTLV